LGYWLAVSGRFIDDPAALGDTIGVPWVVEAAVVVVVVVVAAVEGV
jgi:hypothetical protein